VRLVALRRNIKHSIRRRRITNLSALGVGPKPPCLFRLRYFVYVDYSRTSRLLTLEESNRDEYLDYQHLDISFRLKV
jgi:hypothetical protein